MGIVYKTTQEVIRRILELKSGNQNLSVRKIADMLSQEIGERISKSTINNLLKQERLSSPVGRRCKRKDKNKNIILTTAKEEFTGIYLIKLINKALGGAEVISQLIRETSVSGMSLQESEVIGEMLLFLSFYEMSGGEGLSSEVLKFFQEASGGKGLDPERINVLLIESLEALQGNIEAGNRVYNELVRRAQEADYLELRLSDNSALFIDAGLNTVWSDTNIPGYFSSLLQPLDVFLNNSLISNREPFVLFVSPELRRISRELEKLIVACVFPDELSINKINIADMGGDILKRYEIPASKHDFIVGLPLPMGKTSAAEYKEIGRWSTLLLGPYNERFSLCDGAYKFNSSLKNEPVSLRMVFLARPNAGQMVGLLTNIGLDQAKKESVARAYWERHPDFGRDLEDFMAKIESFLVNARENRLYGAIRLARNAGDVSFDAAIKSRVKVLSEYTIKYFFPECYQDVPAEGLAGMILNLKGYTVERSGYTVVKFGASQDGLKDPADVSYIQQKANSLRGTSGAGPLWFEVA